MTLLVSRTEDDRCPACGAANAACGGPSTAVPVDHIEEGSAVSGPLQKYRYVGKSGETVLKLNEADAKRLGLGPDDVVESTALQGEHGPEIVAFSGDEAAVQEKKGTAPNKARQTAANKGGRAPRKVPPAQIPGDEQGQGGDEQQAAPQGGGDGGPGGGD